MAKFRTPRLKRLLPILLAGAMCFSPLKAEELELVLQSGHQADVTDAIWLDNTHVMSGSYDGSIKVWDVETKRVKRTLWHPEQKDVHSGVRDLIPSTEGVWALYDDATLVLWSAEGAAKKVSKPKLTERVYDTRAVLTNQGQIVFYGYNQPILFWDPVTGEEKKFGADTTTTALAVTPDGKNVAFVAKDKVQLSLVDASESLPSTFASRWGVDSLLFDQDSDVLYVGTSVNWIEAWRTSDKSLLYRFPVNDDAPPEEQLRGQAYGGKNLGLSLSHFDQDHVLVQASSGDAFLLSKVDGKLRPLGSFAKFGVNFAEVSPDKRRLVGSYDDSASRAVPILDLKAGATATFELGGRGVSTFGLEVQDSKLFLTSLNEAVFSMDLVSGLPHRRYRTGHFPSVATGPNRLYCGGNDGILYAYEIDSGRKIWERDLTNGGARFGFGPASLALDPTGRYLAVMNKDVRTELLLLDPADGATRQTIPVENRSASALTFSSDGQKFFYAVGREVHLYDVGYRKSIHSWKLKGHATSPIVTIAAHPLRQAMICVDSKGKLATLDPTRLDLEAEYVDMEYSLPNIRSMRTVGSKLLISAGLNSYLCGLDGKIIKKYGTHSSTVSDAIPVKDSIISTGWDARTYVWDEKDSSLQLSVVTLDGGKEWLAISPDFRFDGSEAAQDLIEWRWNGELFSVSRFYEKFYQPGLLAQVLNPDSGAKQVSTPRADVLGNMPPTVTLEKPKELGNGEYEINIKLEGKRNGDEEVRLYHNGHRVPGDSPYRIKAVEGKNRLRASAFNSDKTVESTPARLTFVSDMPPQPTTLHIFAAAVNDYPNPLDFAVPDAKSFTQAFEPGLYDKINRVTLLDKEAGKAEITEALAQIDCQPQDTLLVFLAGHGTIIDDKFHYLPYGSDGTSSEKALSSRELGDILSKLPATRQVLFLDTCHAGASAKDLADLLVEKKAPLTSTTRGSSFVRDQKLLARRAGTFLVAGSTPEATAAEVPELGHGIFTYAVLEGLKEKNSAADDKITVNELLRYLNDAVPELSQKFRGTPHGIWQFSAGQDFPIAKP